MKKRNDLDEYNKLSKGGKRFTMFFTIALFVGAFFLIRSCNKSISSMPSTGIPDIDVPVENSGWDNSVFYVVQYLKSVLKDPDSYEGIEWTKVETIDQAIGKYRVRHKYRAKNGFGGYSIENQVFYLDSLGGITKIVDIK